MDDYSVALTAGSMVEKMAVEKVESMVVKKVKYSADDLVDPMGVY